jgi:hypothetical protein
MSKRETLVQQYLRAGFPLDAKHGPYETIVERNAIPMTERYLTMMVGVNDIGNGESRIYYLDGGLTNNDWKPVGTGDSDVATKVYKTTWSTGIADPIDNEYTDFVIPNAIEGEILAEVSAMLFIGKVIQTENFSIETTNILRDTFRVYIPFANIEGTLLFEAFYNGGFPATSPPEAPAIGKTHGRKDYEWVILPNHVVISQEDYDALNPPDNNTFYYIPEA